MKIAIRQAEKLLSETGEAHLVVKGSGGPSDYEVIEISEWPCTTHTLPHHIAVPQGMKLSISPGNIKLVFIPSVSLPPPMTCGDLGRPCYGVKHKEHCYAMAKMYLRLPGVKKAWDRNWSIWKHDERLYFAQLASYINMRKPQLFRFHVGGDCPDQIYLDLVKRLCEVSPRTRFLMFTKSYDIGLDFGGRPDNLGVVLSIWPGMELPLSKYAGLPWAWIEGDYRVASDPIKCSGLCTTCEKCWELERLGRDVMLPRH